MIEDLIPGIENELREIGLNLQVESFFVKGGGSINDAYVMQTNKGRFFVKVNDARNYPMMFQREREGLRILRETGLVKVPEALVTGNFIGHSFIVMTYIEQGREKSNFWEDFGQKIAALHTLSAQGFGLENDNYIGSLVQKNTWHKSWSAFYVEERLAPLVRKARDLGRCDAEMCDSFEILYGKMEELFPVEKPSLIHGDLWGGNFVSDRDGDPVIYDPAVYFGHREMDLAMSKLFGGFEDEFYQAYDHAFPLEKNWEERTGLASLYPLLVHVILFGASYSHQVKQILMKYV